MKKILIGRDAGTYVGIAGGIMGVVAAVAYLIYGASNMLVLLPLLAGVILETASVFMDQDILIILAPICCMLSLCAFVIDSVYIFVAYFFRLAMFGDITLIGPVSRICVLTGMSVILLLISSFTKKQKTE